MKWLLVPFLYFSHWYYIPIESPSKPVEINSIDLNLKQMELAMTFFSLTDGEAALIQHPDGQSVLINTGGKHTEQELRKLLDLYQVSRIDAVILTSNKTCCVQNLNWIIKEYSVQSVISGSEITSNIQDLEGIKESVNYQTLSMGEKIEPLPGVIAEAIFDDEGIDLALTFLEQRILWLNQPHHDPSIYLPKNQAIGTTIVKLPRRLTNEFISGKVIKELDPQMAFFYPENREELNNDLLEQLHHSWIRVYHNHDKGAVTVKFTMHNYEIFKITNEKK